MAATNRLFEICLPYLIRDVPKRATPLLARLHALARSADHVRIHGPVGGRRENAGGGCLSEAEDRHHGASVYVTKVYEQERTRLNELIRYAIRKRLVEV